MTNSTARAFSLVAMMIAGLWGQTAYGQTPPAADAPVLAPMPLHDSYNPNNPFARMIRGELPFAKVYEDKYVLAFMDYAPAETGHVLVISKVSRARNLLEEDPKDYARLMEVVKRVGEAQVAALGALGFTIIENNGAGQSVPHLHIHVIPRMNTQPLPTGPNKHVDQPELEAVAAKLRAAMQ